MTLPPKRASESCTEMVQMVLPNDTNPHGTVLGGMVMHWMDIAAATTAHRHARNAVVTVSVDSITFEAPMKVGQVAILHARLTSTGRTSMEIKVDVRSEDLNSGEQYRTSSAYFTFVSIDENGKPQPVPPLLCEDEDSKRESAAAEERRAKRLERRQGSYQKTR